MSLYGSSQVKIEIDVTDGGSLGDITPYVTKLGDVTINRGAVESTPFGVSFPEYLAGVLRDCGEITVEGFFNDAAAPAPNAVFNGTHAVTRSFKITWGVKYTSGECWITDYKRGSEVGGYVTYSATLRTTGTIIEG